MTRTQHHPAEPFHRPGAQRITLDNPFWVEFSFHIDPVQSAVTDALVHFTAFDASGGAHLVNVSVGQTAQGKLRYKDLQHADDLR